MVVGDVNRIDLSISSFERMITEGNLYVDKTQLIERFLNYTSSVQLVARQRRLGKSLNMDMIRCFLTDKEDLRHLFKGLYIEKSPVWNKANSAPVFYFDFKTLTAENYRRQIVRQIDKYICSIIDPDKLKGYMKRLFDDLVNSPDTATNGLLVLTEIVYEATGKRSYLLIDEYDKLLMDNYNSDEYEKNRAFITALFSDGLKGNMHLEKALLTGVMRISHESIFSGLNNIVTFDVFSDKVYTDDYGFTDEEIAALNKLVDFDVEKLREWYNGVRIGGHAIYNTYSVMSYLMQGDFGCFWGKSGTMNIIATLLNDERKATLLKLLNGECAEVAIETRISIQDLSAAVNDQAFYSLLVQAGYLALDGVLLNIHPTAIVYIPNTELMIVWKQFIIHALRVNVPKIRTLFDNVDCLELFSRDIEYFLRDRLSYHDLAAHKGEDTEQVQD